nr:eukaryotic translation initiation factor 2-alpha kinase 1 [Quercus suber]
MSKFFRSSSSIASDSSDSSSDDLSEGAVPRPQANKALQASTTKPSTVSSATDLNVDHAQLLLHALLEERCMQQVLKDHSERPMINIEAMAKAKYQHLSQQLVSLGLVRDGLDHEHHASTRETYRSGLDMLMHSNIGSSSSVPPNRIPRPRRHLLTNASEQSTNPTEIISRLLTDNGEWPKGPVSERGLGSIPPAHFLDPSMSIDTNGFHEKSRYFRDFQEIDLLGKGGFGAVFHVKNRIDDGHYAIKKIPFGHSYLEKIRVRGLQELDHLLREVRTLARLDHPNIVRYYAGWIEEAQFTALPGDSIESISRDALEDHDNNFSFHTSTASVACDRKSVSLRRVYTQSDSAELDVVFETSTSLSPSKPGSNDQSMPNVSSPVAGSAIEDASLASQLVDQLPIVAKYSMQKDHGWSSVSSTTNPMDNEQLFRMPQRVITLCVQMSLHPFTLAEFLCSNRKIQHTHCYHLQASIDILLAIMDGCEYLHRNDIVHRDLKPANILMGTKSSLHSTTLSSSDSSSCKACLKESKPPNPALEIRIGDFGLVDTLARTNPDDLSNSHAVGTEIYRPANSSSNSSIALDIYALGIIAFEILWTKAPSAMIPSLHSKPASSRMISRIESVTSLGAWKTVFDRCFVWTASKRSPVYETG